MTKQQILAEIAAKIDGQGSAIDAGSALPGILRGILDLIPAEQVNSDWNATEGPAEILNKPTIPSGIKTIELLSWNGHEIDGVSKSVFAETLGCSEEDVDAIFARNTGQLIIYLEFDGSDLLKCYGSEGSVVFGSTLLTDVGTGCWFSVDNKTNKYYARRYEV